MDSQQIVLPLDILKRIIFVVLPQIPDFKSFFNLFYTCKLFNHLLTETVDLVKLQEFYLFVQRELYPTYEDYNQMDYTISVSIREFIHSGKFELLTMLFHHNIIRLLNDHYITGSFNEYGGGELGGDELRTPFTINIITDLLVAKDLSHYLEWYGKESYYLERYSGEPRQLTVDEMNCDCNLCCKIRKYEKTHEVINNNLERYCTSRDNVSAAWFNDNNMLVTWSMKSKMDEAHDEWLQNIRNLSYDNFILCYEISGFTMIQVILDILDPPLDMISPLDTDPTLNIVESDHEDDVIHLWI